MRERKHRLWRFLLFVTLGFVVLVLSLPLWFPWVLRPIARNFGFAFKDYHRDSYRRFTLSDVTYSSRTIHFSADRVSAAIPLEREMDFIRIANWRLQISPTTNRASQPRPSIYRIFRQTEDILAQVLQRVPRGFATNGAITWPGQTLRVPWLEVFPDRLAAGASWSDHDAALDLTIGDPHDIEITALGTNLHLNIIADADASALHVFSTNRWATNNFTLNAQFGQRSLFPDLAILEGRSPMPATLRVEWRTNHFTLAAEGQVPVSTNTVAFRMLGSGDVGSLMLTNVQVSSLGVELTNTQPVIVHYARPTVLRQSAFHVRIDPAEYGFPAAGELVAQLSLSGPLTNISHSGRFQAGPLSLPPLKPVTVDGSWNGTALLLDAISAEIRAGTAALKFAGSGDTNTIAVHTLSLSENGRTHLKLDAPFHLSREGIDQLRLSGENLNVQLSGTRNRGTISFLVEQSDLTVLTSFLTWQPPSAFINRAELSGAWDNAPVKFNLSLDAMWNDVPFQTQAEGDATGVRISRLQSPYGSLRGAFPASINPAAGELLRIRRDDPVQLSATADQSSQLWNLLTNRYPVSIRQPDLRAEVAGTLRNPAAQVNLIAAELRVRELPPEIPSFENLALSAHISGRTAQVDRLVLSVAGQPVTFSGHVPLEQLDWRAATARLQVASANLAPFTPLFRDYLAPDGLLRADVRLAPGGKLGGKLVIDGASTRPLATLGAIQNMEIVCDFSEQSAKVKSVGLLGGEALFAVGQVEFGPGQWLKGKLPPFELQLHGENLPLSRQVDALVRGDVNVTLRSQSNAPALVTGTVNLRNSLFLRDIRDLIPGSVAAPAQRPPYFSVETSPFSQWRLDLDVVGEDFLRVRTPLFQGMVSANLHLTGTLEDPLAIGDLSISSGTIRLPFATLPVTHGLISLGSANPYRPQLFVNAADRAFGYEVKLSVTGPADAPLIQFSSTPPLSSEQILLMVTAGEMPRQTTLTFTAEQRAQRMALFLGRGLLSEFGLGGDASRLTIRSGENVTETGRPTYSVEYELSEDWAVIGQYDRFNDFNLMLRWQVYAR